MHMHSCNVLRMEKAQIQQNGPSAAAYNLDPVGDLIHSTTSGCLLCLWLVDNLSCFDLYSHICVFA